MKLINDIGKIKKDRRGIYECPDCKKHFETSVYSVRAGRVNRCVSCRGKRNARTHGEGKGSKLYNRWLQMRYRCSNKNIPEYKYYGGKGIKVCLEWENNYLLFKEWMHSNGYQENKNLTIDRIDSDKDYTPLNCRLISLAQNVRKSAERKEKTKRIKISQDEASEICEAYASNIYSYMDIAKHHGVTKQTIFYIVKKAEEFF